MSKAHLQISPSLPQLPPKDLGVLGLIGNTPMVEITRLDTGKCRLFVKLENQNPGGSIKDRIALSMIEAAEKSGALKPGGSIIEATAGNTGLGLALVAARKGYKLTLVVPDKMAREKVQNLKALGAEVYTTRSDVGKGHAEYYQDVAERIAKETGAYYINQFANMSNPYAHETTTGPEIWQQMDHDLDAMVVGVGSGGTLVGLANYFKSVGAPTKMILADPVGSILAHYIATGELIEAGSWAVEGVGEDFIPPLCDLSSVRQAFSISDRESMDTARDLLLKEGILAGSSSGTLVAAALRYCREQTTPQRVCTFICDSGNKYLSKMFNDYWLMDEGFRPRALYGDVRDLVSRRFNEGGTITVAPDDSLATAFKRMRSHDISQLPVMQSGKLVGLIDESDILRALSASTQHHGFVQQVSVAMVRELETLDTSCSIADAQNAFAKGQVAVVMQNGQFYGLATRTDLINHLKLHQH